MKISVIIVTRNRQSELLHCLGSLVAQSVPLDELIIVDNNSTDDTRKVVNNFKRNTSIPVRYVMEKRTGYPIVYNRGLKEAQHPWVAFIDDDCVADSEWLAAIKVALKEKSHASALIGPSATYFEINIFSLTTLFFDRLWKLNARKKEKIIDFEILDNKNVAYNMKFLIENNISFDESRLMYGNGASEDCDLGMQIQVKSGQAFFVNGMKITHKDPTNFFLYYRKLISSVVAHQQYEKKWSYYREKKLIVKRSMTLKSYLVKFIVEFRLSLVQIGLLMFHIFLTLFITRFIKFKEGYFF